MFAVLILGIAALGIVAIAAGGSPASIPSSTTTLSVKSKPGDQKSSAVGVWTLTASMNTARASHTATLLPNGKVLVAGGAPAYAGGAIASAEIYDPATNVWTFTGSLATSRLYHTATLLVNGKVLVASGDDTNGNRLASAELYDPATGTWSPAASLAVPHGNHTATLLQDGTVLVAGGFGHTTRRIVERFDPAANTWTTMANLNDGRAMHTGTLLADGRVLVAGGWPNASGVLSSVEIYDPAANTWTPRANLTSNRVHHQAALLTNGKVLVAGGNDGGLFADLATAELYDPVANTWAATAPMASTRLIPTATVLQDGRVLITGGSAEGASSADLFDQVTGVWSNTPELNSGRRMHTATLLQNGKVLVAGGYDANDLAGATAELYDPVASPNAGEPKILFARNFNGNNYEIYTMQTDGTNQTRLTTNPAYDDQPKWSPDSSKIVFMSDRGGNFDIFTMNADGTAQTNITNSFAAEGFPVWSPNGTKIAFVRGDLRNPSSFEIYVMDAAGTNQTRLTNDSAIDGVPAWSPDGSKIVFMTGPSSVFDPNGFEIFTMNALDGSNRTRLTNNNVVDGSPSYSPDGSRILFGSGNAMNPNSIEVFVMNADGSNRRQLTTNSVTDGFPAWSFDGTSIVFAAGSVADERSVELFVMDADGRNRTRLTTNTELDWFPDWQRIQTPASTIEFAPSIYSFSEGVTLSPSVVTVTRSGNTTGIAQVRYETSDTAGAASCNVVGAAASSRCDYQTAVGTLTFAPGESSKTVQIFFVDDSYAESTESFSITLSNVVGSGTSLGTAATASVGIIDNDAVTGANPIDNPNAVFFVRQHYLDFLNREPDGPGLLFWTNEINSCGSDQACTEVKRINVSAAFFLSIEFQETGFLVYRLYKAAYNPPGIPVPVRYSEFLEDTRQVGMGVIVGQGDWQAQLEANKQAYLADFVLRLRFVQDYPYTRTPAEFVDKLYQNAGVTPTGADRTAAINEFGVAPNTADTAARARVLRRVAENTVLAQQEFNKAFVLMQYFGYLRRNPFDPPEATLNFDGYNFWLDKLNQFNGNYITAEMVKAFINSSEYRLRFGP